MQVVWVAIGGGVGTAARYGVNLAVVGWLGQAAPWATVLVNVVGSFCLGVVAHLADDHLSPEVRGALATGVMGGLTTYSTFSLDTWRLLDDGSYGLAAAYALGTFATCLLATIAGVWVGRWA